MSIRLSEAIRLGAMLGPQAFGEYRDGDATCAIGAALIACGRPEVCDDDTDCGQVFPSLGRYLGTVEKYFLSLALGINRHSIHDMTDIVTSLNDHRLWTREQIADWLVESGNDCESVETAPAQDFAAALISQHMVAK